MSSLFILSDEYKRGRLSPKKAGIILTKIDSSGNKYVYIVIQRFYPKYNDFLTLLNDIIKNKNINITLMKKCIIDFHQELRTKFGDNEFSVRTNDKNKNFDKIKGDKDIFTYISDSIIKPFLMYLLFEIGKEDNKYDIISFRYGFNSIISFPKGTCEYREQALKCAKREFKEETGKDLDNSRPLDILKHKKSQVIYYMYKLNDTDDNFEVYNKCGTIYDPIEPTTTGLVDNFNTITQKFIDLIQKIPEKININSENIEKTNLFTIENMNKLEEYFNKPEKKDIRKQFEIIDSGFIELNTNVHITRYGTMSIQRRNFDLIDQILVPRRGGFRNISKKIRRKKTKKNKIKKKRTKNKSKKKSKKV